MGTIPSPCPEATRGSGMGVPSSQSCLLSSTLMSRLSCLGAPLLLQSLVSWLASQKYRAFHVISINSQQKGELGKFFML